MSFLNPVNETVLRFSSTDPSAPQINYNARTAGDVKAVLKACLVTGYGDKASAGWSIVNEVNHVAEFVSPSAAMSDYRLGIDDTSASSTTWYYQYQDSRVNMAHSQIKKTMSDMTKNSAANGWQLLVTNLGIFMIEILYATAVSQTVGRVTYWGQAKSAVPTANASNITFFCIGFGAQGVFSDELFTEADQFHSSVAGYTGLSFSAANSALTTNNKVFGVSNVELIAPLYRLKGGLFVASQPGIFIRSTNSLADLLGVKDIVFNDRPYLAVCISRELSYDTQYGPYSVAILLQLDNWEY